MGKLNQHSRVASKDMCTFLILNVSSFQLVPVTMIAYRSQYGSANPSAILGPAIIATFFSTLAGILFSKIMYLLPEKQEKSTYYKTAYRGAAHHRDAYSKDKGGHIH